MKKVLLKVLRMIFNVILVGIAGFFIYYGSLWVGWLKYGYEKEKARHNSYYLKYSTKDYNNSRIKYFANVLKDTHKHLLKAKSDIDFFEWETKRYLAIECIERESEKYDLDFSVDNAFNFFKNTRNEIVDKNETLIKKYEQVENILGSYWGIFRNDINLFRLSEYFGDICSKDIETIYKDYLIYYVNTKDGKFVDKIKNFYHINDSLPQKR